MRRLWTTFFCCLLLLFSQAAQAASLPQTLGEAALLMDARNGQVLYQKNASSPMYPASTTKILTAIIALEHSRLDEVVTVSREAARVEGSAIGLQEGERLTMEDLLYALLLASANDAAIAIAEHVAGSVPAFAALMNEKARSIGARASSFQNPSGLPDPRHYTTAHDLALIARYAMQNPTFRTIVSTRLKQIRRPDADRSKGPPQEHLWNHNRLLSRYEGAIGVKTGYTVEAGQCLVAAAQRDNRELIAVILNSQGAAVYSDARVLLDYGFSAFKPVRLVEKGEKVSSFSVPGGAEEVEAITGNSFYINFPAGEKPSFERKIVMRQDLRAPLSTGQKVGELVFTQAGGKELGRVELLSARAVEISATRRWFAWLLGAIVFVVALRLRTIMVRRRRRRLRYPPYLR
ncbi:D-alanyl-D-alanine carboxypeptidase [Desulfofundulus sp. TPOSR]|uniref:serine-type D-Ala-D-Ala carboxypeptidase n=1 Tax=Desulfofundulus kuznetsovii (strain DSM 6115 / VKM B-1805 / 17) TaxID=760568 RepID=A0AAU8PFZ7_DESK7|nr:D-alanyl-D-alanine carboxypeptidase family protein [Desulfofundulus sp. TPOSR]AEG14722.1 Serine-type D-Ala-D-Ala carboxypeptidase [Desulfofundulus kuznetsovii DSM 6115]NHM25842.1 D-alanyl-D-alanine carboxypeptidase [Desulfofundulus sp. TPOSR]